MNAKLISTVALVVAVGGGCGGGDGLENQTRALTVDPAASGIEHVVVVMMENRSFDHLLGWLAGADGGRPACSYPDRNGHLPKHASARPRFPGLRAPRSRSLVPGRARRVRRRRVRRLAARRHQRQLRHRLLHASRPGVLRAGGAAMDGAATAISPPSWPRPSRTASTSTPPRPIACTNTFDVSVAADDLGSPGRSTGSRAATTSATCRSWRCGARSTADQPAARRVRRGLRWQATCPRCRFVDPRFVDEESGTSGDDHPHADIRNGEAFLNLIYTAVTAQPRLGPHRAGHQLRRMGRLLRSRAAARPRRFRPPMRRPATPTGGLAFATAALLVAPWAPRRRRVARPVRSHVGAAHDRVALGPRAADGARPDREQSRGGAGLHADAHPRRRCSRCPPVRSARHARRAAPSSPDGPGLAGLAGLAASLRMANRRRVGRVDRRAATAVGRAALIPRLEGAVQEEPKGPTVRDHEMAGRRPALDDGWYPAFCWYCFHAARVEVGWVRTRTSLTAIAAAVLIAAPLRWPKPNQRMSPVTTGNPSGITCAFSNDCRRASASATAASSDSANFSLLRASSGVLAGCSRNRSAACTRIGSNMCAVVSMNAPPAAKAKSRRLVLLLVSADPPANPAVTA